MTKQAEPTKLTMSLHKYGCFCHACMTTAGPAKNEANGTAETREDRFSAWVGALAKRWERRLREGSGPTYDPMQAGMTMQLRECLDELRAEMESAPTSGTEERREPRTTET